jgi:Zn-dependent peptidase ImmA (M78 family)
MLKWARENSGTSIEEAYEKFGKVKIDAWEAGNEYPTYAQLRSLSDYYRKPMAVFFFPHPPKMKNLQASCRTLPTELYSLFNRELVFEINKARAMQLNLYELYNDKNPALVRFSDCVFDTKNIKKAADQLRRLLSAPLYEQKKIRKMDDYFEYWRDKFYNVGIFVFKAPFNDLEVSGFCLYDDEFPVIFINNTYSHTRQVFTLFHEIFHLMAKTSGLDIFDDKELTQLTIGENAYIESSCNRFASVFLVPDDDFTANYVGIDPHNDDDIKKLASLYSVSREVILRKIKDRGDISNDEYILRAEKYNFEYFRVANKNKNNKGGGDYYNNQVTYKGNRYIEAAYTKYYERKISISQLSNYMGMSIPNLETLAARKGWISI